jgi:hypothetical protein
VLSAQQDGPARCEERSHGDEHQTDGDGDQHGGEGLAGGRAVALLQPDDGYDHHPAKADDRADHGHNAEDLR